MNGYLNGTSEKDKYVMNLCMLNQDARCYEEFKDAIEKMRQIKFENMNNEKDFLKENSKIEMIN